MNFYKTIEANTDQMVSDISTLIKYKSIQGEAEDGMPYGKEMDDALNCVLDLAEKMGFRTKKLDGYCGYAEYGESDTYIGIFSHVDVNDEDDNEWKYDPYGGIVDQGRIYGSSAVDKGALIAVLYALKAVKELKCSLKRKVRLIIGTDNRRYFSDMDVYMKHENPPIAGFSVDGHFPVTYAEKALSMFEFEKKIIQDGEEYIKYMHGGKVDNLVPGYCSAKLVTQRKTDILKKMEVYIAESRHDINAKLLDDGVMLEVFGKEKHCASIEKGINSIAIMLDFLRYIQFGSKDLREVVEFLCDKIGFDIYGERMGIGYEDELTGKTTLNLGTLAFEDGTLTIRIDSRFPITANYYQAIEVINSTFEKEGFQINECSYWPPTYLPKNHFLIEALLKSYREVTGDDSEPVSGTSASYSKVMANIAAFGAHYPGEGISWEQIDEYLEIDTLIKTTKIYANAIYRLCTEI